MKYVVLMMALLIVIPLGLVIRNKERAVHVLVALLGASMFFALVTVNLFSHETYRGADRGFEVTSVDLLTWTIWFALPPAPRGSPYQKVQAAYFLACALSLFGATVPLFVGFSLWKLVRMFLFVAVVWRVAAAPERLVQLMNGLAGGLIFQALYCIKLRYLDGAHQVAGVFSHQNSLGMAVNLVAPLCLARFMYTGSKLAGAGVMASLICVVFTLSRGSLAMLVVGLASVYFVSFLRGVTVRKVLITVGGMTACAAILAKSFDTIRRRFLHAPEASADARDKFVEVAGMMLDEHPFGVGMNLYSYEIQHTYGPRLGLAEAEAGIAHHIYWLTAAETGYAGLIDGLLLGVVYLVAIRSVIRGRRDYRGQLAMGCLAGLTVMYLQGSLEWIARQTVQSYLFWIVAVIAFALLDDLKRHPSPLADVRYLPKGR